MKKKVALMVAMFLVFVVPCQKVFAYDLVLWGLWNNPKAIYFYFAPTENNVDYRIQNAVYAATNEWNNACSGIKIMHTTFGSMNQRVNVLTVNSTQGVHAGALGITYAPTVDVNGKIISMIMEFNLAYPSYLNDPGGTKAVAAHEFGHVLNLNDRGESERVLMNGFYSMMWEKYRINTPQQDDKNGVNYLY